MDALHFLNRLKKEFWPSSPSAENRLIERVELKRNQEFESRFTQWIYSSEGKKLQKDFVSQIKLAFTGLETPLDISIMNNAHSRGLYFHQSQLGNSSTGVYLFEFLRRSLETLGYSAKLKEQIFEERGSQIHLTERYQLKPRLIFDAEKMDQRFGNIIIERREIDRIPDLFSLQNNFYTDRKYLEVRPFSELIEALEFVLKP